MPTLQRHICPANDHIVVTSLRGRSVLHEPELNKGTAFTAGERAELGLLGLLPPRIETLDEQCDATRDRYDRLHGDLERHIFLRALEDTNEVLFYAFLERHLAELLPIVYTPTVGVACEQFSHIYRRPHGLFLSYPERHLLNAQLRSVENDIEVIVVTDGERILGLGDQGLGGMGIPIGKLALYTVAGGVDPRRSLPVLLDVGTNNQQLLDDPLYLGWRHERITGPEYDAFIEKFVAATVKRFPGVLLQWEDFGGHHAAPLLDRYRDRVLSFNDDIQGTAAVAAATVASAVRQLGSTLAEQRILIAGAGSAGCGIAGMIVGALEDAGVADARRHLFLTDVNGLVHDQRTDLTDEQLRFATPLAGTADWCALHAGHFALDAVVAHVRPTVLIGVSGVGGLFDESLIRCMAASTDRPVVLPLSNPTSRAEATPADILAWTDGRAVVATGSPFDDVVRQDRVHRISQANNVYVFPGLGLGALVAGASKVSDAMLRAASNALAASCPVSPAHGVLPALDEVRATSRTIAGAVALAAVQEGLAPPMSADEIHARIAHRFYQPRYPTVRSFEPTSPMEN